MSVDGFSRVNAFASSGHDTVELRDSVNGSSNNDDVFDHRNGVNVLYGEGYQLYARGFDAVEAVSTGGSDIAQIFDTAGNDLFYSNGGDAELVSESGSVAAKDFKVVNLVANRGGFDRAVANGTAGADVVRANDAGVRIINSNGQTNNIRGVDLVEIDLGRGADRAVLTGSQGRDTLSGSFDEIEFETTLRMLQLTNVEQTNFDGNGGGDVVDLEDLDLLESLGDRAQAYMNDRTITVEDFAILEARSVDNAIAEYSLEAIDYLYSLRGQWVRQ